VYQDTIFAGILTEERRLILIFYLTTRSGSSSIQQSGNSTMASITASLTKRPGEDAKVLIGKAMLRENFDAADLPFFERYFTYYEKELGLLSLGKMSNVLNKMPQAATTHADILNFVDILRMKQDSTS
jgi:hypothetical protein